MSKKEKARQVQVERSGPAIKPVQQTIFTNPVKTGDAASERQKTLDGFANFGAKIGANPCDGTILSQGFYEFNLVTRNRIQLEAAYRGSWVSRKMIDIPAEDMTRAGIIITTNDAADKLKDFKAYMNKMQISQSLANVIRWGTLYGGCLGVLQIKGQKLDSPLDLDTIQKDQFQGIAVYDRWQLNPDLTDVIDSGPEIGLPKFYQIVTTSAQSTPDPASMAGFIRVHYSRCIRMGGSPLPFFQAITEMMWDASSLEVLWDRLISFDTAALSAAGLITRANLRTVSIENLREILAAGGPAQEALEAMFEMMRRMQTNEGLTILDKEDVFASTAYSFAGLSDLLLQFAQHLSGATDIPLIRLFSQSPSGMNATGESDLRLYYDGVNARQEMKLRNPWHNLIRVGWCSLFGEMPPDDIDFTFAPLWQMTPVDKATVSKSDTEVVVGAFDAGLIKKSTTLKELSQNSKTTGLFTNITDEEIAEAEDAEKDAEENPPMPEAGPAQPGGPTPPPPPPAQVNPQAEAPPKLKKLSSNDSAWKRIRKWVNGK